MNAQQLRTRAAVLLALPGDFRELMQRSGLSYITIKVWTRRLRDESEIHIAEYRKAAGSGPACPVWVRGAGEDAPPHKPKEMPKAMRLQLRRENAQAAARAVKLVKARPADGILTAAMQGQKRVFALAGVWA